MHPTNPGLWNNFTLSDTTKQLYQIHQQLIATNFNHLRKYSSTTTIPVPCYQLHTHTHTHTHTQQQQQQSKAMFDYQADALATWLCCLTHTRTCMHARTCIHTY